MQEVFTTIILGFVQGILEFLPVSSSAHLKFFGTLLNNNNDEVKFFLELATFTCVLFYFRSLIIGYIVGIFSSNKKPSIVFFGKIIISCLPFAIAFPFLYKAFENISLFLILGSMLMLISEFIYSRFRKEELVSSLDGISFGQSFIIGCFQVLSVFSGFSRSGSTICGGLFCGVSREIAVKFSFLISLPLTFGALCYDFYKIQPSWSSLNIFAFCFCFFVAFFAIKPCFKLISRINLGYFAFYRTFFALFFAFWHFFSRFF